MEDKKTPLADREFLIEDEDFTGDISLVSIVKSPAIGKSFQMFSNDSKYRFAAVDKEQQTLIGPIMCPDQRILRQDEDTKEFFNCWFSKETVKKCSELFLKNCNHTSTSLEHGEILPEDKISGVYMTESWIVDNPADDKSHALGFKDIAPGTWFGSFKVTSPSLWAAIKENGFTGFSLEGNFEQKFSHLFKKKQSEEDKIKGIVFNTAINDAEKEKLIKKILGIS